MPGRTVMFRSQLLIDAALSVYEQERFVQIVVFTWFWSDSSPQGRYDWLVTEYMQISTWNLLEAFGIATELWTTSACVIRLLKKLNLGELDDNDDHDMRMLRRRYELDTRLAGMIQICTLTPIAIASGNSGVDVKTRGVLHGLSLKSPAPRSESMSSHVKSACSFTIDLGTESHLADNNGVTWTDCLLPWSRDVLDSEIVDDSGAVDHEVASGYVWPHALNIAAMLHIVANLTKEMDFKLPRFNNFLDGLQSLLAVLSVTDFRERFVNNCVKDSTYPHLAF